MIVYNKYMYDYICVCNDIYIYTYYVLYDLRKYDASIVKSSQRSWYQSRFN